jgi:hypothetical protein
MIEETVVLSSCLLGSVYIFSTSLRLINESCLEERSVTDKVNVLNGTAGILSGLIFLYTCYKATEYLSI